MGRDSVTLGTDVSKERPFHEADLSLSLSCSSSVPSIHGPQAHVLFPMCLCRRGGWKSLKRAQSQG